MLPCTLRLPHKSNNPTFKGSDKDEKEEDLDYQRLSDFSSMMATLKIMVFASPETQQRVNFIHIQSLSSNKVRRKSEFLPPQSDIWLCIFLNGASGLMYNTKEEYLTMHDQERHNLEEISQKSRILQFCVHFRYTFTCICKNQTFEKLLGFILKEIVKTKISAVVKLT
ncbi:hypothetical protein KUTeg_002243 [Tegillarca granosa]|uniref:Uncharacterized protein n=1 Tax=Tegillarca granosa TaxID=220873 RepID=A0ABQ9FV81_TEGGR|nr:hypothetical protein KUTeg_002243 [Tegillarca granosa]